MHTIIIGLFAFSERSFCVSAAWDALPAGGKPAVGAFYASGGRRERAEKVDKLLLQLQCKNF